MEINVESGVRMVGRSGTLVESSVEPILCGSCRDRWDACPKAARARARAAAPLNGADAMYRVTEHQKGVLRASPYPENTFFTISVTR